MNDVAAWQECVDNSNAQLEHQALRFLVPFLLLILLNSDFCLNTVTVILM